MLIHIYNRAGTSFVAGFHIGQVVKTESASNNTQTKLSLGATSNAVTIKMTIAQWEEEIKKAAGLTEGKTQGIVPAIVKIQEKA